MKRAQYNKRAQETGPYNHQVSAIKPPGPLARSQGRQFEKAKEAQGLDLYTQLVRPILFSGLKADPEWLHQTLLDRLGELGDRAEQPAAQWVRSQIRHRCTFSAPSLGQTCFGLSFANPVGLAAGFDKNGQGAALWSDFGFGFAELGTVTWHPQPGNPKPRLFRLPQDQAVLNRMGFNNHGALALAEQLRQRQEQSQSAARPLAQESPFPLGINLGKSKITPLDEAVADYCQSFTALQDRGDYFVVNVSSPNTPGLRQLQAVEQLSPILAELQALNQGRHPLLIKIAPDLTETQIAELLTAALDHGLAGIIATNTTVARQGLQTQRLSRTGKLVSEEAGGLSGPPLRQRSTEIIRFIYRETQGQLPIIGVGGVASAEEAWEKITAGASLVQLYTGWVYQGPGMMRRLLQGLEAQLERQKMSHLQQAIGTSAGRISR